MRDDLRSQARQDRKPYSYPEWQYPRSHRPKYMISEKHDSPINTKLNGLAFALFKFDFKHLKRLHKPIKRVSLQTNTTEAAEARNQVEEYIDVRMQWKDIQDRSSGFANSYLTDQAFIPVWNIAFKKVRMILSSSKANAEGSNIQSQFQKCVNDYMLSAGVLERELLDAAGQGLLSEDIEKSVEARWRLLDDFLDWYFMNQGPICKDDPFPTRDISSWQVISNKVRDVKKTSISNHKPHSYATSSALPGDIVSPILLSSLIFTFGAALSAGLFAVGHSRSSHEKGSIYDADFWFSIQASSAQATCLVCSTLLTWKSGRVLTWHCFVPTGIAGICTLLTAPLYIFTPTEWASFSALVATMLQSVLILQQFLFTSVETRQERDRKSK